MTARGESATDAVVHDTDHDRTMLNAVSTEMVALYKTQLGRGPTKVRTDWAGADALLVTLEDSLTPAEHRLVEMGEHARLRDTRTFFQYAAVEEFIEVAERLTKRRVRAFVSGIDTGADVCSEVFYFDPEQSLSRSRDGWRPPTPSARALLDARRNIEPRKTGED
jgi:uncharacterized protein YbcI